MIQYRRLAGHERSPRLACGIHQFGVLFRGDSDHWNVLDRWVLLQFCDEIADIGAGGSEVGQDDDGFLLFGTFDQGLSVSHGTDPVIQILQAVDQLGSGQQFFVNDECERLSHCPKNGTCRSKRQKVSGCSLSQISEERER